MYKRHPGKNQNYKMFTVGKKIKEFYPVGSDMLFLDAKNRLRLNGSNCYLFANHVSAKECKKEKYHVVNKIVERNLNPKKCWSDSGMFAYVKNNNLYITGYSASPYVSQKHDQLECFQYEKPRMFFQGKGSQVKDVVCGEGTGGYGYNIFVLLKDGSVWGMGNNVAKLISNSKTKYFDYFVQIVAKGVNQISVSSNNVAVVKNDDALYVWGHTMKSRSSKKYKSSVIPIKITTNVSEADISGRNDTTLVFRRKNGVAYGMGLNSGCILTDKYKKGWHKKPVRLMGKVKHVYTIEGVTFILKKNRSLYWTGTQDWNVNFGWVVKKLSKK